MAVMETKRNGMLNVVRLLNGIYKTSIQQLYFSRLPVTMCLDDGLFIHSHSGIVKWMLVVPQLSVQLCPPFRLHTITKSQTIEGSICFLEQETLHSLLSTGLFQESIRAMISQSY